MNPELVEWLARELCPANFDRVIAKERAYYRKEAEHLLATLQTAPGVVVRGCVVTVCADQSFMVRMPNPGRYAVIPLAPDPVDK